MTAEQLIQETIIRMGKEFAANEGYSSIRDINHGECEIFRDWVVSALYDLLSEEDYEGVESICIRDYDFEEMGGHPKPFDSLLEMPYHAWFIYNGKSYDVEAPGGVDYWFQLPFYQRLCDLEPDVQASIFAEFNEESRRMQYWGLPESEG